MSETAEDLARVARIRTTFDLAADGYDGPALGFFESISREVVALLALHPGSRVLDVPCGTVRCHQSHPRRTRCGWIRCWNRHPGTDAGTGAIREIGSDPGVQFGLGDLRSLDEAPAGYDVVLCVFGIFFVPNMAEALRGLWNLVAPGGRLVVVTWAPNDMAPLKPIFLLRVHELRPTWSPCVQRLLTCSSTSTRIGMTALFHEAAIDAPVEFIDINHSQPIRTRRLVGTRDGIGVANPRRCHDASEVADVRAVCDAAVLRDSITQRELRTLVAVVTRPATT